MLTVLRVYASTHLSTYEYICIICACCLHRHALWFDIKMLSSLLNLSATTNELAVLQERLIQTEKMMERIVSGKSRASGRYIFILKYYISMLTAQELVRKMTSFWDKSAFSERAKIKRERYFTLNLLLQLI